MKAISLLLVLVATAQWCAAYSTYQRPAGYSSGYTASSSYSSSSSASSGSSSSSSSSSSYASCCQLNSWAYEHIEEVRQFAGRLRQEYNTMSHGGSTGSATPYIVQWNENIIQLTGKTGSELDALCRSLSEQLVADMQKGLLTYTVVAQPYFFEWKAAETLEMYAGTVDQQQEQIDIGHYQPVDLSNFDEVKNYAYPAEVKVIDNKTYVVHKNCTEATKTTGQGTFDSPLVHVLNRNRTTITTNTMPGYTTGVYGVNNGFTSGAMMTGAGSTVYPTSYLPPTGGSTTTVTRKKTIYDWVNQNMEPSVTGYQPTISLGSDWSSNLNTYKPAVTIPVSGGLTSNSDVETFSTANQFYRPSYSPTSTVTVRRYNKTVITRPDGTNTVHGSESNKKWVDGKLVYDTERPFGQWSVPRDEAWKREERERLFWFLTPGYTTEQNLEAWQRQHEERLLAMASRYHTTIEQIQEWHRKELERYGVLLRQYQAQSNDVSGWKRMERGRLDWLIHQNSVTREELERWQRENNEKLVQLARQYQISLNELKEWQVEELNRLYEYYNDLNSSMISVPASDSLSVNEQERLDGILRQHNATMTQLQNSIQTNQQILRDLAKNYRGNVQDMEKWLKDKLAEIGGAITHNRDEMTRITEWQSSERGRLEDILKQHRGSVEELNAKMARDRSYLQSLASKYHVSIEELEKWQTSELTRLQNESRVNFESELKEWQKREHAHLMSLVQRNDLTIDEFKAQVMNDRARLESLANTYKVQVGEVEEWIMNEIKSFQSQGLLKEVEKELALWQQKERDRLAAIVRQNELTVEELQQVIKSDQSHLNTLAQTYHVRVEEIEEWLKKELLRLQGQGLIKAEDLKEWQKQERDDILKIVQQNKLTMEEFEQKLLADRQRLHDISITYNVKTTEIEKWIKEEGQRLQNLGLLKMQEELNNWQKIEKDRLLALINKNNLSIEELEEKIKKDQVHLYSLAHQHQVRVEEIEEWIKKEIKKLQDQGLLEMEKLKDWQTEWRGNLTNMVQERDFTVEEFHKWLLEDRSRLQALAMQHNVQIEEIEQWINNEEQRFVSMGLLKPNEKLTNWQEVERRYLERITQQQYHSTEQLEERLRQDRELLEKLAGDYSVQVEEIEQWMKKELARLRDDGQLQIDNLTAWQIAERERLEELTKRNKQWSVEEFEAALREDREHMQTTAFQYHTSVEEIEKWIQSEVDRLRQQGKLNIEQLTAWQKTEQQRIFNLLQQQSSITVEEFERKVERDRMFVKNLADQYHVSVVEVEEYVKKIINDLRAKGKFEAEKLQQWQLVERNYIKQLINQYKNGLSTVEYEQKLLADRTHLRQLADQYKVNTEEIEKWMIEELRRLRNNAETQVRQLAAWQVSEAQRLKELIQQNSKLTYVQFEVELIKEQKRLQDLAKQYSISVEEVEQWLRQQLVNLKTTGDLEVESLTKWQEVEQKRLIDMLLQHSNNLSYEEFEKQLQRDQARLQQLSQQYSVSVEEVEKWMRDELERLKASGLLQVENLTYWQKIERDRLQEWLRQQNDGATFAEFNEFLKRDKQRIERIAHDYHITVDEVISWVQQEGTRLQILGMIQRPENYITDNTYNWRTNGDTNYPMNGDERWKDEIRGYLMSQFQLRQMNWPEFEKYLVEKRYIWVQKAEQYKITPEQIEAWLRQEAKILIPDGTVIVEEWQSKEQLHIENLLNDKLRTMQKWSIEELERQLKNDRDHLQMLATQYGIAVEEIESWYKRELNHLLDQRRIITENLMDWQKLEKVRLYDLVKRRPGMTLQQFEDYLLHDKMALNGLANEYHISVVELEQWIRNELRRLMNLGEIRTHTSFNNWREQERQRLNAIAVEISITEGELLDFIAQDHVFQQQLARMYGCGLHELAPVQRLIVKDMQARQMLDNTKLLTVLPWQKLERDRLYNFIKIRNISLKNLKDMQRQTPLQNKLAADYGITVAALESWQTEEFERLMKLAEYYRMSLYALQNFREQELLNIRTVMHQKTSTEEQRISWAASEAKRMEMLHEKSSLKGAELKEWRRKLYLLSQGLLPMDFGGFGGYEQGPGTTNRTAPPQQIISSDRGDQPPNVYEEMVDNNEEPGVAGGSSLGPLPPAKIVVEPSTQRPVGGVTVGLPGGAVVRESGYRYTMKESITPAGVASASASADMTSSSANAAIGMNGGFRPSRYGSRNHRERDTFNGMESHSLTDGHQDQQEEVEDFGQQQQQEDEMAWNGHLTAADAGQQQVQVEDLSGGVYQSGGSGHSSHGHGYGHGHAYGHGHGHGHNSYGSSSYSSSSSSHGTQSTHDDYGQQQQVELNDYKPAHYDQQEQVQVEDLTGTFTHNSQHHSSSEKQVAATVESQSEVEAKPEDESTWTKLKGTAKKWFG